MVVPGAAIGRSRAGVMAGAGCCAEGLAEPMEAPLSALTRIEFTKLWHKKESYLYFTMCLLPLLYGIGFASGSSAFTYRGTEQMSCLQVLMLFFAMSYQFLIFHIFLVIVAVRAVGSEIEDHSILLLIPRVNHRRRLFAAKLLAVAGFALVGVAALVVVAIVSYYALLARTTIASGAFSNGSDVVPLLSVAGQVILTLFLMAAVGAVFSLFMRTLVAVAAGTVTMVVLFLAGAIAPVAYAVPFFYLVRSLDVANHAEPPNTMGNPAIVLGTDSVLVIWALGAAVTLAWLAALTVVGTHRFRAIDL